MTGPVNQTTPANGTTGAATLPGDAPAKTAPFSWTKTYLANSLWSMVGTMLDNSNAVQDYIYNGLQQLALKVAQTSEAWSTYNMGVVHNMEVKIKADSNDPSKKDQVGSDTTEFNMDQSIYQMFMQFFGPIVDGINNTATNGTQQQAAVGAMISNGPMAVYQTLLSTWH